MNSHEHTPVPPPPESGGTTPRQQGHGLRRDIDLLEALASPEAQSRGGLGVVRLSQIVGREKSQVSRALKVLAEEGIVERDPDTLEYGLGWRLFSLVARTSQNRLVRVAEPVMHGLSAELEETTHLCVLRDHEVLTLLSVSGHSFRTHGWEGRGVPAAHTSAGRVLLMDATPDELYLRLESTDLADGFPRSAAHSVQQLWARVQEARRDGYAQVNEEFEVGLVGVSAPVRDFRGRVVAALNVSAPRDRMGDALTTAGRAAARAAGRVSTLMGWERRPPGPSTPRFT
ncbi:IclR family transcriptional regulator [Streptomyces sp. TS71-3]|uniref:IclR family transcriptional regulator n=1 Tax=Streptomyces sp. TS71-3 TaxID=2733862 RepID=UPI001B0269A8|nr:IclR family transcriptional regulator [Streptomyces sp. TS71-3]GHJ37132.1 IclR family transcriptional regulator [Streptomyces sp. TS71-3]